MEPVSIEPVSTEFDFGALLSLVFAVLVSAWAGAFVLLLVTEAVSLAVSLEGTLLVRVSPLATGRSCADELVDFLELALPLATTFFVSRVLLATGRFVKDVFALLLVFAADALALACTAIGFVLPTVAFALFAFATGFGAATLPTFLPVGFAVVALPAAFAGAVLRAVFFAVALAEAVLGAIFFAATALGFAADFADVAFALAAFAEAFPAAFAVFALAIGSLTFSEPHSPRTRFRLIRCHSVVAVGFDAMCDLVELLSRTFADAEDRFEVIIHSGRPQTHAPILEEAFPANRE